MRVHRNSTGVPRERPLSPGQRRILTLIQQATGGVVVPGNTQATAEVLHRMGLVEVVGHIDILASNLLQRRPIYTFKKEPQ